MNEATFIFFMMYVADLHNLKVEKKLRCMARPKCRGIEKANSERLEALSRVKVLHVTETTPGYMPAETPRPVVANSVAAVAPKPASSTVKLFYQTSASQDFYCVKCHKGYKSLGTLGNHLRVKHGQTLVIKCDRCHTIFEDAKALNRHMKAKTDCTKLPTK